jgi:hypothetical protein
MVFHAPQLVQRPNQPPVVLPQSVHVQIDFDFLAIT